MIVGTCEKKQKPSWEFKQPTGEIKVGIIGGIDNLFPFDSQEYYSQKLGDLLLFPSLLNLDANGRLTPGLCHTWQSEQQGELYTLHLNTLKKWSDGKAVTAHDAQATYQFLKRHERRINESWSVSAIERLVVKDSLTLEFHMRAPGIKAKRALCWPVLPKPLLMRYAEFEKFKKALNEQFVGCGSFIVKQCNARRLHLIRNRYYSKNTPYLKTIQIRFFNSEDRLIQFVRNNTLHMAYAMTPKAAEKLQKNAPYRIEESREPGFTFIAWNTERAPFASDTLRKALTHAIDRRAILDGILWGYGEVYDNPTHPGLPLFKKRLVYHYDPDKARKWFKSAGWNSNTDNEFLTRNGDTLKFELMTNSESRLRREAARNVKRYLRSIGVKVDVRLVPWSAMVDRLQTGRFDAAVVNWLETDPMAFTQLFHSEQADSGYNVMRYRSYKTDSLIESLFKRDGKNSASWKQLQQQIINDQPITLLYNKRYFHAVHNDLKNVRFPADYFLANVKKWYLSKETDN